ncbi:MAG: hypothetical protein K8H86_08350 [Ignavibacteriaceae bacterium]|nr:hypothetical protein [Ignavibacteriaceae bacterium]
MNKTFHKVYIAAFFVIGISVTLLLMVYGYNYYSTPIEERFFNASHKLLKPSGVVGHGLGIIGTLMMIIGVVIYMVRKRFRAFFNLGYLKHWLEFHIFLCTVGPILVLFHTAFKFGGIVSVSFWSMVLVVLSGIAGRFIYVQIPRTIQGQELSIIDLNKLNDDINNRLLNEYKLDTSLLSEFDHLKRVTKYSAAGALTAFIFVIKDYFEIKVVLRKFKKEIKKLSLPSSSKKEAVKTAKQKLILSRRIGLLRTMQKLFKYWHVAHLPFALIMIIIMFVHVAVTIVFGYKWIF